MSCGKCGWPCRMALSKIMNIYPATSAPATSSLGLKSQRRTAEEDYRKEGEMTDTPDNRTGCTSTVALAGCRSGQLPDRWVSCGPGRGWNRFRGGGTGGRSYRGLDYRSGRMVSPEAVGLVALDRGDEHRNGRRPHRRRGTRRLRDKPRGPAAHGCDHRPWCGRVAG